MSKKSVELKIVKLGRKYHVFDGYTAIAHFDDFEDARVFLGEQRDIYKYTNSDNFLEEHKILLDDISNMDLFR